MSLLMLGWTHTHTRSQAGPGWPLGGRGGQAAATTGRHHATTEEGMGPQYGMVRSTMLGGEGGTEGQHRRAEERRGRT